ncbi:hypothetical protein WR25_24650 [Diploscapter pachys]|uniref:Ubiquitin conjugation factor E4 core domain-containing protein n=1 Tax=Diploscapter pachys TaxID=2018661 RepID=A0A2A2LMG8_9BILA|nr:hypothetical protein WR25_24650 [Diploscapter pachys]
MLSEALFSSIINHCTNPEVCDAEALSDIFDPILTQQRRSILQIPFWKNEDRFVSLIFDLLNRLLSVKLGNGRRPICDLLVNRPDFHVKTVTNHAGREFTDLSFLGAFFSYGLPFEERDAALCTKYFEGNVGSSPEAELMQMKNYQSRQQSIARKIHSIIHPLVVNGSTRTSILKWIATAIEKSEKRRQMRSELVKYGTHRFFFYLQSVLYDLSSKIELDKVNPKYPFQGNSVVDIKEKTRMKMMQKEAEEYEKQFMDVTAEEKFTTICFFLTMHCADITLPPALEKLRSIKRHLYELKERIESHKTAIENEPNPTDRRRKKMDMEYRSMIDSAKRINRIRLCYETYIKDPQYQELAIAFAHKQLSLLMAAVPLDFAQSALVSSLPEDAPELFRAYPEFYLEDLLNLYTYDIKNIYPLLAQNPEWAGHVMVLFCCMHFFNNPFLTAKLVEVLTLITTVVTGNAQLWMYVTNQPLAKKFFVPALIKFYSEVETGVDFYEKFSIRRNIQVIFKSLWESYEYRSTIIALATLVITKSKNMFKI